MRSKTWNAATNRCDERPLAVNSNDKQDQQEIRSNYMEVKGLQHKTDYSLMSKRTAGKKMSLVDKAGYFKGIPDEVKEKIQETARKDAENGVYTSEEYVAWRLKFKEDYVSPDRADLAAKLTSLVQNAKYTDGKKYFFSLLDKVTEKIQSWKGKEHGSGTIHIGAEGFVTMSYYDNNGEEILAYNSFGGGGWISVPTKAEEQYDAVETGIYYAAYTAACAELKERAVAEDAGRDGSSKGFETRA